MQHLNRSDTYKMKILTKQGYPTDFLDNLLNVFNDTSHKSQEVIVGLLMLLFGDGADDYDDYADNDVDDDGW